MAQQLVCSFLRTKPGHDIDHGRPGIDWDSQPLGVVPDKEIAARLGVAPDAVCKQRNQRGLAPVIGRGKHNGPRGRKTFTDEQRQRQSERIKGVHARRRQRPTKCDHCQSLPTVIEYGSLLNMINLYGDNCETIGVAARDARKRKWSKSQYALDPARWRLERFRGRWLCRECLMREEN